MWVMPYRLNDGKAEFREAAYDIGACGLTQPVHPTPVANESELPRFQVWSTNRHCPGMMSGQPYRVDS